MNLKTKLWVADNLSCRPYNQAPLSGISKNMNKTQLIVVISAAIVAMAAGLWLGTVSQQSEPLAKPPTIQGLILPEAKQLAEFNLMDAKGSVFAKENLKNNWSLIFVGYTHCPDVCPITLSVLRNVVELMQEQQLESPRIIFISVDPERDTPETLEQYVKFFNEDFVGVTGRKDELARLGKQLGVFYTKVAGTSGDINADDYLIDHSSSLMLVNPQGNLQAYLTAPHTPMKIVESILFTQDYYQQLNN